MASKYTQYKKTRPMRFKRRNSTAKLTRDQVFAAHKIHIEAEIPVSELAKQLWDKYGYSNPDNCARALIRAFRSYGLKVYTGKPFKRFCSVCGVDAADRTPGCSVCRHRHFRRRKHGFSYKVGDRKVNCGGCGCPINERTVGCRSCKERHNARKRRSRIV